MCWARNTHGPPSGREDARNAGRQEEQPPHLLVRPGRGAVSGFMLRATTPAEEVVYPWVGHQQEQACQDCGDTRGAACTLAGQACRRRRAMVYKQADTKGRKQGSVPRQAF